MEWLWRMWEAVIRVDRLCRKVASWLPICDQSCPALVPNRTVATDVRLRVEEEGTGLRHIGGCYDGRHRRRCEVSCHGGEDVEVSLRRGR